MYDDVCCVILHFNYYIRSSWKIFLVYTVSMNTQKFRLGLMIFYKLKTTWMHCILIVYIYVWILRSSLSKWIEVLYWSQFEINHAKRISWNPSLLNRFEFISIFECFRERRRRWRFSRLHKLKSQTNLHLTVHNRNPFCVLHIYYLFVIIPPTKILDLSNPI